MNLFFKEIDNGDRVLLMARAEGDGGVVGDFFRKLGKNDEYGGVSFEDWKRNAPGTATMLTDGKANIDSKTIREQAKKEDKNATG